MAAKRTKASAKKAAKAPRARRYKSPSGERLELVEDFWGYKIGWWLNEEEGIGAIVGDTKPKSFLPKNASDEERRWFWEVSTAYKAVKPLADSHSFRGSRAGFMFNTKIKAMEALRAANEALCSSTMGEEP